MATSPKQPLMVPKKLGAIAPKTLVPPVKPKMPVVAKPSPLLPKKALVAPTKAPLVLPKVAPKSSTTNEVIKPPMETNNRANAEPLYTNALEPPNTFTAGTNNSINTNINRSVDHDRMSQRHSLASNKSYDSERHPKMDIPPVDIHSILSRQASQHNSPVLRPQADAGESGITLQSKFNNRNMDFGLPKVQRARGFDSNRDSVMSVDGNHYHEGSRDSSVKFQDDHKDMDPADTVGASPWLAIERRINEIRAMAALDASPRSPRSPRKKKEATTSIYGNYDTRYEKSGDWKKESTQPLSYGMLHNLQKQRGSEQRSNPARDRWSFVDGFLKPRRKPFASMSELSRYFSNIKPNDQSELLKLLLACRSLEKVIEEQHSVLDMLDHDLREAREMLRLPEHLRGISTKKLLGAAPPEEPFYPTSDIPLFIKGRVSLLPGPNDIQLSVVNQG
ncbi:hypothetical protein BaOVIS_017100 [Babesia ovis]|uniref:Uncharacterized protein n=1 Tax=Babesia ovis TaxID=5869 RepID=A0A9W5TBG9_BABOV|nr:hypothetical protein BaOVIS_017100 [Babesia ovis]